LIGARVEVRAARTLVRIFHRGQLIRIHPRQQPGRRCTDPDDLRSTKTVYALRDLHKLRRMATEHGPNVGVYASALLDIPLPWTKMRQVYVWLGLVKKWDPARVDTARASALAHERSTWGSATTDALPDRATTTKPESEGSGLVRLRRHDQRTPLVARWVAQLLRTARREADRRLGAFAFLRE
jgi:hypothetical protein